MSRWWVDPDKDWLDPEEVTKRGIWNEGYETATNELVRPLEARVAQLEAALHLDVGDVAWVRCGNCQHPAIAALTQEERDA
jgi:hypothetical protein